MPSQLSAASPGALLEQIRSKGGQTRQQLLAETGMARSTLYARLDALERAGLIYQARQLSSTGGRPASVLAFDDRERVVLTIDIGHHRATVSVCNHAGDALESRVIERDQKGFSDIVVLLAETGEELLARLPGKQLSGVGLALPAAINTQTGTRLSSSAFPDVNFPIAELLTERFKTEISIENDARALTIGAALEVPPLAVDATLIGVKYSTGVGIGLYTGGYIMRGSAGAAGDLGHLQITPGRGPLCTCQRRGCLAAYVSGRALVRDLARPGVSTVSDIARLYDQADPEVVTMVNSAAQLLGVHLGGFVQVTNPDYVVFGGFLGRSPAITAHTIAAIKEQVSLRISGPANYRVVHGDDTTARGLVALVIDNAFTPEKIDQIVSKDLTGRPSSTE